VTEQFKIGLENTRFTSQAQKEKFAKHGIDALNDYYPNFIQFPADKIEAIELNFYGVQIGGEMVTGKIDRIEKNNDGTYSLYDYKTGTPVSGNQISLGGMKEGFYNQLCFYKCAFEKYSGKKVSQVGIIYVENHTKSIYKNFDDSDMDYIENKIVDTYKNIRDLKFEPIKEDLQGPCKFCAYKQLCKLDVL
jgi:ATP-dependent helicase/DNAse subunit B